MRVGESMTPKTLGVSSAARGPSLLPVLPGLLVVHDQWTDLIDELSGFLSDGDGQVEDELHGVPAEAPQHAVRLGGDPLLDIVQVCRPEIIMRMPDRVAAGSALRGGQDPSGVG